MKTEQSDCQPDEPKEVDYADWKGTVDRFKGLQPDTREWLKEFIERVLASERRAAARRIGEAVMRFVPCGQYIEHERRSGASELIPCNEKFGLCQNCKNITLAIAAAGGEGEKV